MEAEDEIENADQQIRLWKQTIAAGPTVRVEVLRVVRGQKPAFIDTIDELPTDDDLRELYGGGTFLLRVKKPDSTGRLVYATSATVAIAGAPRVLPGLPQLVPTDPRIKSIVEEIVAPLRQRVAQLERKLAQTRPGR